MEERRRAALFLRGGSWGGLRVEGGLRGTEDGEQVLEGGAAGEVEEVRSIAL